MVVWVPLMPAPHKTAQQNKAIPGEGSISAATTVKNSALCEQAPTGLPLTPSDLTYSFFSEAQSIVHTWHVMKDTERTQFSCETLTREPSQETKKCAFL